MVTIYDIAKKANCSAMTVSRVINQTGRISEQTRQRVLAIMDEMHYVPNEAARSLVLQETKMLSLLITDITNPFFTSLTRGAEDAAKQLGYRLLLANSDENLDKEKDYMEAVLSMRVDGVLFAPAGDQSAPNLARIMERGVPIVLLDREVPGVTCDIVQGDSLGGAKQLVEYLIGLGHRQIAFVNGSLDTSTARLRLAGYLESLKHHGIAVSEDYIIEANYRQTDLEQQIFAMFGAAEAEEPSLAGAKLVKAEASSLTGAKLAEAEASSLAGSELVAAEASSLAGAKLAEAKSPTALFAANNFLALAAIRALRKLNLRVPEDVSVVCFDDLEADYVVDPFMTVIAQPAYDFGFQGIQLLVERIKQSNSEEQPISKRVVLEPRLIVRHSATKLN